MEERKDGRKEIKRRMEERKLLKTILLCYMSLTSQPSWPNEMRVGVQIQNWHESNTGV